jgi:GAF domain-containing protein
MFAVSARADPAAALSELADQARALLEGERDPVANAANLSALIFATCPTSTGPASTG